MPLDQPLAVRDAAGLHGLGLALALLMALHGCAAPAEPVAVPPPSAAVPPPPAPPAPPVPAVVAEPAAPRNHPVEAVLGYAERIRALQGPELAQEIGRLGDGGDSAPRLMQLAIALAQTKSPANNLRAQALLQRVLGLNDPEAKALYPLARLVAQQLADARRSDEQLERQAQQLREAQRRIDQLNERLEAVRAIERSLPSRPPSNSSAPAASAPAARP
jgi:hypothetical protein